VVFLTLEWDALCTSLIGYSSRKIAVLVLVCCYKARGDREQDLWRYWLSERYIKQWHYKPTGDGWLSKKCELGEQWSSNIAVSCTLAKHSDIQSENTRFETLWLSLLTRISIDIADRSLFPLLFLWSLNILSGCSVINNCSCHQDLKLWMGPMPFDPHTRFHYSKPLAYIFYDYGSLSNISGMYLYIEYVEVLNWLRF
jgi:hypothetical protein